MTNSIRSMLLFEAPEELSVSKEPTADVPTNGAPMTATDYAPPAKPAAQTANVMPTINTGTSGPATIQKDVVNKHQVISVIRELKAAVANFEKQFDGEDLTVDNAKIYIHNFLESLAFFADKIANFGDEAAPETTPEAEPMNTSASMPVESSSDLSEPVEPTTSNFTNPSEAL